jgi:hypothetical protein
MVVEPRGAQHSQLGHGSFVQPPGSLSHSTLTPVINLSVNGARTMNVHTNRQLEINASCSAEREFIRATRRQQDQTEARVEAILGIIVFFPVL